MKIYLFLLTGCFVTILFISSSFSQNLAINSTAAASYQSANKGLLTTDYNAAKESVLQTTSFHVINNYIMPSSTAYELLNRNV